VSDPVNDATIALIKGDEGCRLRAYRDSVGVLTIGYGHTGPDVAEGLEITQERAEELLRADLALFEQGVDDAIDEQASTTDNQYGAMVSLAYNIGLGNFRKSTVVRDHNAGDNAAAANAFLMWDKAGGLVLTGLVRRRHEERALYLTPDA
jgi:lysozyme